MNRLGILYWYMLAVTITGSIIDVRKRSVHVAFFAAVAAGIAALMFWDRSIPAEARLFGILTGLLFLGLSFITKEAVGKGDAVMIMLTGAALGFSATAAVLCIGFLLLSLISLVLVVVKKYGRKERIPFFPFLAAMRAASLQTLAMSAPLKPGV